MTRMAPSRTDAACAAAPPVHRGRPADARGAQLLAARAAASRRASREAWDAHHEAWVIPDEAVDEPGFRLADWFGREAPLVVEIGSGVGEATGVLAAARPAYDVLALEVWRPGVAASLAEVAAAGATNVRFCSVDAVWAVEHLVAPGSVAELWTFFPDPWPKTRHHKRRLVDAVVRRPGRRRGSRRAAPGGSPPTGTTTPTRCATVLDAEPGADRRRRRAMGRATGHEVRAQGPRGRPHDHRPVPTRAAETQRSAEVDAGLLAARARRAAARSRARARR